jgi:hypothetical protein
LILASSLREVIPAFDDDVPKLEVDGSGAEEQLGGELAIGKPLCDERSDLPLLGGERHARGGIPFPGGLAGGPEFHFRALQSCFGAQVLKGL